MEGAHRIGVRPDPIGGYSGLVAMPPDRAEKQYDLMMGQAARHHDVLNAAVVMSIRHKSDPQARAQDLDRAISALENELIYMRRARAAYGAAHRNLPLPPEPKTILPGLNVNAVVGGKLPPPKPI